jgi:DNA polymerase alpha-associated DNA helicase A
MEKVWSEYSRSSIGKSPAYVAADTRMNETIANFPSDTLYDHSLISDASVAKRTLLELPTIVDPASEDAVDALSHTVIFFDTDGCEFYERTEGEGETRATLGEGSKSNENEAVVVCKWVKKLVSLFSCQEVSLLIW